MKGLFFCLLLNFFIGVCIGCKCAVQHPQTLYKQADFVLSAEVLSVKVVGEGHGRRRIYTVNVTDDYKNYYNGIQKISTRFDSAACGVRFDIGKEYVIGGSVRGSLTTHSCQLKIKSSSLTNFQKDAFHKGLYKSNCQIRTCRSRSCLPQMRNECVIYTNNYEKFECLRKNDACVRNKRNGRCEWLNKTCRIKQNQMLSNN